MQIIEPLAQQKPQDTLAQRIVEELWQKGYDLQQFGAGWIVREPLGGSPVQLASDAELVNYASGRARCAPARMDLMPIPTVAALPAASQLPVVAPHGEQNSTPVEPPELWLASWKPGKPLLRLISGCFILGILLTVVGMMSRHRSAPSADEALVPAEVTQATPNSTKNAATLPPQSPEKTWQIEEVSATSGAAGSKSAAVKGAEDMSVASALCISQLQERFSARAPTLIPSPKNQSGESCYAIDGREHCPYHARGQAVFLYVDAPESGTKTYACDVSVSQMTIGNIRQVKVDPGIVRFLVSENAAL